MTTDEVFVSENPGLHVTVVRGIHSMSCEDGNVRLWTFDQYKSSIGMERRINGHLLMTMQDLMDVYDVVTNFIVQNCMTDRYTKAVALARVKGH